MLGYEKSIAQATIAAPPEKLFLGAEGISSAAKGVRQHRAEPLEMLGQGNSLSLRTSTNPKFLDSEKGKSSKSAANLDRLQEFLRGLIETDFLIFFVANSQAQLDRMAFLLAQKGLRSTMLTSGITPREPPGRGMVVLIDGRLSSGFTLDDERICFLSENEVFGAKKHRENNRHQPQKSMAKAMAQTSLDDLQIGEHLVHVDHGIGRYRGLIKLSPDGVPGDYVFIEYAAGDKLYLPIYRLDAIQKYVGAAGSEPSLERLGSQIFTKAKERARAAVKDIAAGLLEIYARRAASQGYAFPEPDEDYRAFEAAFPYDETPDQLKAIQETIADMCSDKPMDRLVCGDVGYGKTEVAMRAACLAVTDAKQVAVLVPTTVLAEQHMHSFRSRFAGTPFRIESLSRFRSKKEQSETIAGLREGKIDIVIGTHRLLSRDVEFKDLGLMIVDEEQRFGVEHKEKLKKLRATTDVLTLTATPIPRTLHFAMLGIRDITIIQTPPADRLAIRTYVAEFNEETIREALENEIKRGGQAFFIHNRVQSMPTIFRMLGELMPKLKIGVAHGQMPETELEQVMVDFYQKKFDLLLCTAIIENGLDVPSANTIIINRADTFGLSQLYQIRGRVGRSQARAFAYLLLPNDQPVTDDAKERLQVLQRHVELGSGFIISSHDLELRGAGDILGDSQSGHVTAIGYDLYLEMLAEEIARLRGEEPEQRTEIEISSPFSAFLPEDYVPDPKSRLSHYKRFTSFTSEEEIEDGKRELIDRYGPLPLEAEGLLWLLKIKLLLARFGFKSLRVSKTKLSLEADKNPKVDIPRLLELIRKRPKEYSFGSDSKLVVQRELTNWSEAHTVLRELILNLANA
jgi:transcription-repair coupling factor (superfamily II helicase)